MNVPLTPLRFKSRALRLYGRQSGVICGDLRFTYSQFFDRCDRLARALISLGIGPGDRVAFLAYNCHRLLEGYYGVVQMGAVLLPLNLRLSSQDLTFILNDSGARVVFFDSDFAPVLSAMKPALKTVEHLIPLDAAVEVSWASGRTYEELLEQTAPGSFGAIEPSEDDVAEIFYTSGTTAPSPKGVMLTHRNLYLHALNGIIGLGVRDTDVMLHTIPLFHVNGWGTPQSLTCMGGTHVMVRKFDPPRIFELLEREHVTFMCLVPMMANALVHHPAAGNHDYSSLRVVYIGGAAPAVPLIRRVEEVFNCSCYTGYGLTETSPILSIATLKGTLRGLGKDERLRRQAMTGWQLVGTELRVVDESGRDVRPDGQQIGEVIARGDGVMKGYWGQPEETAAAIRNGWFYTGDMATQDEEGYILIVDRKKDIIISGGENIASIEVEKCLYSHPAVFECAVVAAPHPVWGEVPKALVVLNGGVAATEEEILAHCKKYLAGYQCPHSVEFLETLPKGGTGKILKRQLREKYWIGVTPRVQG